MHDARVSRTVTARLHGNRSQRPGSVSAMLEPAIRQLASTGQNFGSISFHLPDGRIGSHVMWVDSDEEHVLINTEVHRAKYRAIQADPNVTVMIWSAASAYQYAEVRGRVVATVFGPEARAHIDAVALRYTGAEYAGTIESERVILKIAPDRQIARNL
jgi:Pyridoxamine 5'-phosphate oxidase